MGRLRDVGSIPQPYASIQSTQHSSQRLHHGLIISVFPRVFKTQNRAEGGKGCAFACGIRRCWVLKSSAPLFVFPVPGARGGFPFREAPPGSGAGYYFRGGKEYEYQKTSVEPAAGGGPVPGAGAGGGPRPGRGGGGGPHRADQANLSGRISQRGAEGRRLPLDLGL